MNAWYINGQALLEGKQSLLYFLVPYRISFFLFVFPETWLFNHLSGIFPNYAIPIGALNPKLNPGPQWGISIIPGLLYDFLLKIPLILSDVLVTILLFKIVKSEWQNEKTAILVAALWFLNPIVIWVSSGWGMFDTLPALFTVLSLYFVLDGRYNYSMLALTGSTLLKFYAIVIFVPLILIIWRKAGTSRCFHFSNPDSDTCDYCFTSPLSDFKSSFFHFNITLGCFAIRGFVYLDIALVDCLASGHFDHSRRVNSHQFTWCLFFSRQKWF